jgi:regulator of ribosome biosynthesis
VLESDELKTAAALALTSTASLGKFQPKLGKKLEQQAAKTKQAKKRKFEPNTGSAAAEKERNLGILEAMGNKRSRLDLTQAVGQQIFQEDKERSTEKRPSKKGGGGKKGGKKGKGGGKFAGKKGGGAKSPGAKSRVGAGKPKGKSGGGGSGSGRGKTSKTSSKR